MIDPIRVVVADDQAIIRDAVAAMLDLQPDIDVVGTAADGAELVTLVRETTPDVVLTDLRMPGVDGAEATRQIGESHPGLPVVVLTTFDDDASVFAALDAGAVGYLTKDADRHELAAAIRTAAAGSRCSTGPCSNGSSPPCVRRDRHHGLRSPGWVR